MKTIFKTLLMLAIVSGARVNGQNDEKYGFIRLVNALAPGEGSTELLLDGNNLYPDGYNLGDATGGMGVPVGTCNVTIRKEGVTEGMTKVKIEQGATTTVIPFGERVPATDQEPAHWEVRILRLKQKAESNKREATFVSVSQKPEVSVEMRDPAGNWDKYLVKRFGTTVAPMKYPEGYIPLRAGKTELPSIPVMDVGNYVVVLFDGPDGDLQSISFRDFHHVTAE
ncbi:hypothetical protein [Haloferula sargassicola]|uniref:Uncharacterized protein n=1 Tax=Haloferula sargassicola TaxID=490096 RepID=A0ABP9UI73_9BACT